MKARRREEGCTYHGNLLSIHYSKPHAMLPPNPCPALIALSQVLLCTFKAHPQA